MYGGNVLYNLREPLFLLGIIIWIKQNNSVGSSNPDTLFLSHFNFYYRFFSSVCINKVNLRVSYKENKGLKLYPVVTSLMYRVVVRLKQLKKEWPFIWSKNGGHIPCLGLSGLLTE